jgi:Holliday junction resolvase RusA-like endonuclease
MQHLESGLVGRFFVAGRPRTKGSLKPIHVKAGPGRCRVSLVEDHKLSEPWKMEMILAIVAQCGMVDSKRGYAGPVEVCCAFYFEREPSVNGGLKPTSATDWPIAISWGDLDKLQRNLLDALQQSGLIADDSQVVRIVSEKAWADESQRPGVWCEVRVVEA